MNMTFQTLVILVFDVWNLNSLLLLLLLQELPQYLCRLGVTFQRGKQHRSMAGSITTHNCDILSSICRCTFMTSGLYCALENMYCTYTYSLRHQLKCTQTDTLLVIWCIIWICSCFLTSSSVQSVSVREERINASLSSEMFLMPSLKLPSTLTSRSTTTHSSRRCVCLCTQTPPRNKSKSFFVRLADLRRVFDFIYNVNVLKGRDFVKNISKRAQMAYNCSSYFMQKLKALRLKLTGNKPGNSTWRQVSRFSLLNLCRFLNLSLNMTESI